MWEENRRWTFSLQEALLWIIDSYFGQKQQFKVKTSLFLTSMQLLASQDMNWWTGAVWITCELLWCLFGLSFWRHPFTAEDPSMSMWWNATFPQICSNQETNSSTTWMDWGWVNFPRQFFFGVNYSVECIALWDILHAMHMHTDIQHTVHNIYVLQYS